MCPGSAATARPSCRSRRRPRSPARGAARARKPRPAWRHGSNRPPVPRRTPPPGPGCSTPPRPGAGCPGGRRPARPDRPDRPEGSPWGRAPARIGGMRALTVVPGQAGSARLDDVDDPPDSDGPVLVETLAIGVCGTDAEIIGGAYGWAPPGRERLVLGHESVGRVLEAPPGAEVAKGDLVVGIVRRPDPVPCGSCAVGEWDMC